MKKLILICFIAILFSCKERVKIVEIQSIYIRTVSDTIYTYKIERSYGQEKYYDIISSERKFNENEFAIWSF